MKLHFIGADHEVTGSAHFLSACGKNILVDYGMEQGVNVFENADLPVSPSEIDYILVTHAHVDHTGMIPALYKNGFKGKIFATVATCELCNIMLRDSAHIQEFEAEWKNRKNKRAGKEHFEPPYTMEDVEGVIKHFYKVNYNEEFIICEGIRISYTDVGHLLGSASIKITITEGDITKVLVFSGDIGNINQPIIKDPAYTTEADFVIMESTYGDRLHGSRIDYVSTLSDILNDTFSRGGNVVIPSFAVGRTQEILYFMRKIKEDRLVYGYDNFEVFVDSPLAIEATNIFNKNFAECFDEEAMELINAGINPISFSGLKTSITSNDSIAINFDKKPKVIISASGMCEAGRIRHHLKHNLWRRECTILFVGYQAVGTLGRILVDGAERVKLFGEEIEVNAEIKVLAGVSGHADKNGLISWVSAFNPKPSAVFIVHGEDKVAESFRKTLTEEYKHNAYAPYSGSIYDLTLGEWEYIAEPVLIKKETKSAKHRAEYEKLLSAGKRLIDIINANSGLANKDMNKFAEQIEAICNKWK
ncbi:MAG: MBL fold metallo-hydrolase RNA specificity domain-containing protein [Catonella sp.]|uniref:MBL fold metallo-hydrolase RNA specificity domain-containing protein n=1 Tax=Catonella sp. TaxID=2382125 RepID=UPI003FA18A9E